MANKKLKAEIITLRNRVDELAARVAALESRQWTWRVVPTAPGDTPWYPVITCTDPSLLIVPKESGGER